MSEPRKSLKPLSAGLGPKFADLQRRAEATVDMATHVRAALPAPEKDHVVSVSYRDETLVVAMDSAAWSSRLRYAQQELLERLRAGGVTQFTKVRVKVGRGAEKKTEK